jgi:alkylhydroperoxidase family enzyme
MSRIEPARPPYEPAIAEALQRIIRPGLEPLVLFRTMAKSPRVFAKMFASNFLDKGSLSLRQRELVIDRTTARLGCEYEWGVHIALFAERAGFDAPAIAATVQGEPDDVCWAADERALLLLVDDLVDQHTIRDETWRALKAHFDETQILEAIAITGRYHTISFLCRGLDLPLESYAARFPG